MANAITKQQILALDNVKLIDIRSAEEYQKMHIPDAANIPAENLTRELAELNADDTIVCICNHGKERSQQAADELYNAGFRKSFYLQGGTFGWDDVNDENMHDAL